MKPMDFQEKTAERILQIYKSGKQNRVLLADEVGLGKTIIASAVVRKVADWQREEKKKTNNTEPFRVIYICSNMNIANQNYRKLGIAEEDCLSFDESRLSMQHLKIYEKQGERSEEQLIPMTPATSFSMTGGQGIQKERALIYAILSHHPFFSHHKKRLSRFMKFQQTLVYWEDYTRWMEGRVTDCNKLSPSYIDDMVAAVEKHLSAEPKLYNYLKQACSVGNPEKLDRKQYQNAINTLRKIFAEISLELLKPDLVIMDEFQRFKDLIASDDGSTGNAQIDEQKMLTGKFLKESGTRILLLSATPYKPFSTLEEQAAGEEGHYKEFIRVIDFLYADDKERAEFHQIWNDYSRNLKELQTDDFTLLLAAKKTAEDKMYGVMCRTERRNNNIFDDSKAVELSSDHLSMEDIASYLEMQDLMDEAGLGKFPVEYVKSAPYLMSFMNYVVKKDIDKRLGDNRKIPVISDSSTLFLRRSQINRYEEIPCNNARMKMLFEEAFGDNHAELLLWIPASRPYYKSGSKTGRVFSKNAGYSKTLIFSSWEMVPRVIAGMTSYEAERRTLEQLENKGGKKYFARDREEGDPKKARRTVTYRLRNEMEDVLIYPSAALAGLYDKSEFLDQNISEIRRVVKSRVHALLSDFNPEHNLPKIQKSAGQIAALLYALDGNHYKEELKGIPAAVESLLTDLAIAGPAICAYRIFCKSADARKLSESIGKNFVALFNKQESLAVMDVLYQNKLPYYEKVAAYCVDGNLQAVLDEYAFVTGGSGKALQSDMSAGFLETASIQIETKEYYVGDRKNTSRIRTHFAVGYFNAHVNEKTMQRKENIRKAFNSPFRPFVLATTSIGQEGLDFHLYSRKIMHWNLPSNPIDLEQREGRINRYMCHAIRQNLGESEYAQGITGEDIWNSIMSNAREGLKGAHSELVPYWCLPNDFNFTRKIERIVPMYPYSIDGAKYDRIISILAIYRLTLGQPKQEELFEALKRENIDEEVLNELYMNLSPWERK